MGTNRLCQLIILFLSICSIAAPAYAVEALSVVGLGKNMAILQVDGETRVLRQGQTSPEGILLISANAKNVVLEIDGERQTYLLGYRSQTVGEGGDDSPAGPKDSNSLVVDPDRQGMYLVNGSINDYEVEFLIDTGATSVAIPSALADDMDIDYKLFGKPIQVRTASGMTYGYHLYVDKITIGHNIHLYDVPTVIILSNDRNNHILLGMSALSQLHMEHKGFALYITQK